MRVEISRSQQGSTTWLWLIHLALGLALLTSCATPVSPQDEDSQDAAVDTSHSNDTTDTSVDVDPNGNQPPELDRIGNRRAPVGKLLVIEATARDADGDPLNYSVFGDLPEGSKFAKDTHTLEWTPQAADDGRLIILTFAVSDGEDEDRETIQITVTTASEATTPVLQAIGDVFVEPNALFEMQLQATDEDGDKLTFSVSGVLPEGAELDAKTGRVQWTPTSAQEGQTYRVTFVVSDGTSTDSADARFLVQSVTQQEGNVRLLPMRPQQVKLGETLSLTLPVDNPANLPVSCQPDGTLPQGASFDPASCTLTYTPTDPALVGRSVEFTFNVQASSGGVDFNLFGSVTVFVVSGTAPQVCTPDQYEPNDVEASATPITPGSYPGLSICGDIDIYSLTVPAGATLTVDLTFVHGPNGDLDVHIFAPGSTQATVSGNSSTNNEHAVLPNAAGGAYQIWVVEFSGGENTYDMSIAVNADSACPNDGNEPNETFATATQLGTGDHDISDGMLCSGESDWYAFDVTSGSRISVMLAFDNSQGDLDLELYSPDQKLVSASRLTLDEEQIEVPAATMSGSYRVRVLGYQNASAAYLLEITQGAGVACTPDSHEPNDSPSAASPIPAGTTTLSGLTYCGDADYFQLTAAAGEGLEIALNWTGTGNSASLFLLDSMGVVTLAAATPQAGGLSLTYPADSVDHTYVLEVSAATLGLSYSLVVTRSAGACDALSCDLYAVCGDSGSCVPDYCDADSDCPSAYRCRQTYCVDACFADEDCRTNLGYACRILSVDDPLPFCAPSGDGALGEECIGPDFCAPTLGCLEGARFPNGLCAFIGCVDDSDCGVDGTCVDLSGTPVCLPFCFADTDCRNSEGYTCQPLPSADGSGPIDVCIQ